MSEVKKIPATMRLSKLTNKFPAIHGDSSPQPSRDNLQMPSSIGKYKMNETDKTGVKTGLNSLSTSQAQMKLSKSNSVVQINDFYLTNLMKMKKELSNFSVKPSFENSLFPEEGQKRTLKDKAGATIVRIRKENKENCFFQKLDVSEREFFQDKKQFMKLFKKMDGCFHELDHVILKVRCYKPELGLIVEDCASDLYSNTAQLLKLVMKQIETSVKENEDKMKENYELLAMSHKEKRNLMEMNEAFQQLMVVRNSEVLEGF
jgi:gas vesicle protein